MANYRDDDFITLYPGVYTEGEAELFQEYLEECNAIEERGTIDVQAMIRGELPEGTPGFEGTYEVPEALVRYQNQRIDPENRLLSDADYARSLGFQDIMTLPTFTPHSNVDKAFPPAARDTILANQLNGNITSYRPIYPGDTLYLVHNKRRIVDMTPEEGSTHRFLSITGEASLYNQNGEKINDQVWNITEGIRIFKDDRRPMPRSEMGFQDAWEAPEWDKRPEYHYTDKDWEFILDTWRNEHIQGSEPLYWEDVKIGDEPSVTIDGPILDGPIPHESSGHGKGGSITLKEKMLHTDYKAEMNLDPRTGIYIPKNRADYFPEFPEERQEIADDNRGENFSEAEIHLKEDDKRGVLLNYVGRDIACRHINNWMGHHGWLKTIRWEIMSQALMKQYGFDVPKAPYAKTFMQKVPYMAATELSAHPLTQDLAIVHSCVTDKYVQNGEHIAVLTWWIETIDHYIWIDGEAEIRLPSRNEK